MKAKPSFRGDYAEYIERLEAWEAEMYGEPDADIEERLESLRIRHNKAVRRREREEEAKRVRRDTAVKS